MARKINNRKQDSYNKATNNLNKRRANSKLKQQHLTTYPTGVE